MVPLTMLWLPILLSAIGVFVLSALIHMALGYHANDYRPLPRESEVMAALRPFAIPPGDYAMPRPKDMAEHRTEAYRQRAEEGPVAYLTVLPNGAPGMGRELLLWFLYSVVVGVFAGYIAGRALGPGSSFANVLRFAGATAFVGYSLALWQQTIWYRRSWSSTLKSTWDGLLYALLTGAVFAWLWPS